MGGVGGLCEAMAMATEFQGDGTPHGHGFMALVNAYQHKSLQDIVNLIESGIHQLKPQDVIDRITAFMETCTENTTLMTHGTSENFPN